MSHSVAISGQRQSHVRHATTRAALIALASLGTLVVATNPSGAQTTMPETRRWELRFTSGGLVPTGGQRNSLEDAQMSGAQLSWLMRPSLAVTGTFGWARSRDLGALNTPKLDVFTSDVGVEVRPARWTIDRAVRFAGFAGLGAGARSYNYRSLDVDATHNLAAYGAIGGELGMRRVTLRLEGRNYASRFAPLVGAGKSHVRNDVVIMAALGFKRRASQD